MFVPPTKVFLTKVNTGRCTYCVYRQAKILQRLINSEKTKKSILKKNSVMSKETSPFRFEIEPLKKRMNILNKNFMHHISTFMMSGKYSSKLTSLGLEITKVQISSNYSTLKVFWIASNPQLRDEDIADILKIASGELRHEISSLRFMGKFPEIIFVRDVTTENQLEVQKILNSLNIEKDDDAKDEEPADFEIRQNVLSLDHDKITGRIMAEISKHKAIEIERSKFEGKGRPEKEIYSMDDVNLIPFDKKLFAKYYNRRQILQRKANKNMIERICVPNNSDDNYPNDDDFCTSNMENIDKDEEL